MSGSRARSCSPIAHEDHAQRACYAALHLREELRRYADELRIGKGISFAVRMGLNSGELVVGKIGDDLGMDYTALGHTANLAARMEQIAEPGRIYLAEATAQIRRGLVAGEEIESALQTAAETVAERSARGLEPDVLIERARLARLLGDEGRYRGDLSEARRLLTEMGAPIRAEEVARELES